MAEAKKTENKEVKEAEVVAEVAPVAEDKPKATAKAGKRSAKAVKESEDKQAKTERKEAEATKPAAPKAKVTRPKSERAGKKYREAFKLVDATKTYELAEALELAGKASYAKFDASIEMHVRLGVDPKQADQNIRGTVTLPGGTGKSVRVAVLAEGPEAAAATKAGADKVGADDLLAELDKEQIDFDVLVATPAMMPKLAKYARLLGPRGLMPSPKSGTVTADTAKAVAETKAGKVEYRVDQSGIVHLSVGKISLGQDKLLANAEAILASIRAAKPNSLKGIYLQSIFVAPTMGPSIRVTV